MPLHIHTNGRRKELLIHKRSQSALEYMMTYGWAILIIVIVAAVLYSFGIFSPSSSISSTVTGFSSLGSVTGECTANGNLRISLGDSTGYLINITSVTAKSSTGQISTFKPNSTIDPSSIIRPTSTYIFSVPNVCPSAGSHYSLTVVVNYTEPGQVFSGPYSSSGVISGTVSGTYVPNAVLFVDGNKAPYTFPGCGPSYSYCLTGSKAYLSTDSQISGVNQTFTVTMWIYPIATFPPNSSLYIENEYDFAGWWLYQGLAGINYNTLFLHRCSSADTASPGTANFNFYNGTWEFVSFSASAPNYVFALDSKISTATNTHQYQNNATFLIGTQPPNCDGTPFTGYISNVQIYNTQLSSTQLLSLYNGGMSSAPIVGAGIVDWWPLNTTVQDVETGRIGTLHGPAYITSNYVEVPVV